MKNLSENYKNGGGETIFYEQMFYLGDVEAGLMPFLVSLRTVMTKSSLKTSSRRWQICQ